MILHGDCLEKLKELDENSVDSVVTDPPYGWRFMGKAWDDADILVKSRQAKRPGETYVGTDGITRQTRADASMAAGKYDQSLEGNEAFCAWTEMYARELLRVLKPGGHALIFCGPRTYHAMAFGVQRAGFEIRDQLQWLFGSGFPKSHNGEWGGTALKPANEPICLARKPLSEKTVKANFEKWGVGGLNIDASRIGSEERIQLSGKASNANCFGEYGKGKLATVQGRWPANLLLECTCDEFLEKNGFHFSECPAGMLDEQSGMLKTGCPKYEDSHQEHHMFKGGRPDSHRPGNSGGASRFFYVAKASKKERNAGLEGMPEKLGGAMGGGPETRPDRPPNLTMRANHHPTVKPIKLMEYLIKLITPPNGIVLDPFMGSGSTGVAAKRLGFEFIGIELSAEYVEIATKRIAAAI